MVGFFHSLGSLSDVIGTQDDIDILFARRQKLLLSFFMGIFIDLEAMKRKYLKNSPFSPDTFTTTGSGGVESSQDKAASLEKETDEVEAGSSGREEAKVDNDSLEHSQSSVEDDVATAAQAGDVESEMEAFSEASSEAIDNSSQEDALAQILASSEANDGGKSRDESVDLGIL